MTILFGAGYRIRIDTVLLPRDFKSRVSAYSTNPAYMAGVAGLEPANAGVKVLCLTDLAIPQYKIEIKIAS